MISQPFDYVFYVLSLLLVGLLVLALRRLNFKKQNRGAQIPFLFFVLVAIIVFYVLLSKYLNPVFELINDAAKTYLNYEINLKYKSLLVFVLMTVAYLAYKVVYMGALKALYAKWPQIRYTLISIFYDADEQKNVLKWSLIEFRTLLLIFTTAATFATYLLLNRDNAEVYPAIILIFFIELFAIFDGYLPVRQPNASSNSFSSVSLKIANYRQISKTLHGLYERWYKGAIQYNKQKEYSSTETISELIEADDLDLQTAGRFYERLQSRGVSISGHNVYLSAKLINKQSLLVNNPFYNDYILYLIVPILLNLLDNKHVLFVVSNNQDCVTIKHKLKSAFSEYLLGSDIWEVDVLTGTLNDIVDVGILFTGQVYDSEVLAGNKQFLEKVGFVVFIEPSLSLSTSAAGLEKLVTKYLKTEFNTLVVDHAVNGLINIMSHITKQTLIDETAVHVPTSQVTKMFWNNSPEMMHLRIIDTIPDYLGSAPELIAPALKAGIPAATWYGANNYPVIDAKIRVMQYYKYICEYADIPVSQEYLEKAVNASSSLFSDNISEQKYLAVEDEFNNPLKAASLFSTRATSQVFINVITGNYLLKDYLIANASIFESAIFQTAPHYITSQRNRQIFRQNDGCLDVAHFYLENEQGLIITSVLAQHLYQKYLPGQYAAIEGKYYRVEGMRAGGLILRREKDSIAHRISYKQIRQVDIANAELQFEKTVNQLNFAHSTAQVAIHTAGYSEEYNTLDLGAVQKQVSLVVPDRIYENKHILEIMIANFADLDELASLINGVLETLFPSDFYYVYAIVSNNQLVIIEDSDLDIGLIEAVEEQFSKILEIIYDYLDWAKSYNSHDISFNIEIDANAAFKEPDADYKFDKKHRVTSKRPSKTGNKLTLAIRRIAKWWRRLWKKSQAKSTRTQHSSEAAAPDYQKLYNVLTSYLELLHARERAKPKSKPKSSAKPEPRPKSGANSKTSVSKKAKNQTASKPKVTKTAKANQVVDKKAKQ